MDKKRILAIDGGGIKGVMPAAFLAALESATGKKIADYFDLVVGTSTGGIIALGLGKGLAASEILAFYEEHGPAIFGAPQPADKTTAEKQSAWGRLRAGLIPTKQLAAARHVLTTKHEPAGLTTALRSVFGETKLGDSKVRLVVPAFNAEKCDIQLFKTRHHPRLVFDWKEKMVDVALATGAAPSYFPAHRMPNGTQLIDGGVWANTPVAIAIVEAIAMLGWNPNTIHLLSLGCGDEIFSPRTEGGTFSYRTDALDIILHGQSAGALGMAKLLMNDPEKKRLKRLSPPFPKGKYSLDGVEAIPQLKGLGETLAREFVETAKTLFLDQPAEVFVPIPTEEFRVRGA